MVKSSNVIAPEQMQLAMDSRAAQSRVACERCYDALGWSELCKDRYTRTLEGIKQEPTAGPTETQNVHCRMTHFAIRSHHSGVR